MDNSTIHKQVEEILQLTQSLLDNGDALGKSQIDALEKVHRNTQTFIQSYDEKYADSLKIFVSYLNHDALNYVTPILGYSELLAMQVHGALTDEQNTLANQICDLAYALREELKRIHQEVLDQQQSIG